MATKRSYQLADRYLADEGQVFLTGIQALARLPLEQLRADKAKGLNTAAFVSGYQGSPLGGYGEAVKAAAKLAPDLRLTFRPAMNEEYAATAVMGSQLAAGRPDSRYDGVVGIWYGKAPGVDRAADALRHAVFAGTSQLGGAVAIVGDDPAAKSSTVPSSSASLVADMHMPLLYPGDPGEALDLGRHAIAMSRATGLWSALKIVADVADATATIDLSLDRVQPVIPLIDGAPYLHEPDGLLLTPHTLDIEREIVEVRYELARTYAAENRLNHCVVNPTDAWLGIVSSGITYREVREAFNRLGLGSDAQIHAAGIRLLKMAMPMPFNQHTVRNFAKGLEQILVIEEKQPNIESLLKDALYALADRPVVVGKVDENGQDLLPRWGALDADGLVPILRRRLEPRLADKLAPVPPKRRELISVNVARTPFFCSGCPHNRSTEVPDGALVGAGIGCHTMTLLMDPERVGDIAGLTCMGNEGTQWIGMSEFVEHPHLIQNLGDGTYFHSGQLAVQACIAAEVDMTFKLLHNGTVAMTGGQDPQGQLDLASIAKMLLVQGVSQVLVTTDNPKDAAYKSLPAAVEVWDRRRLIEAQEHLATVAGVTVLIHDQACAAEARRGRKRGLVETPNQRVVINHRICEGCGDCGQVSNCLSVQPIETEFGRKTHVDQTTCNLDFSCLEGDCPSFMTVSQKSDGRLRSWLSRDKPSRKKPSRDKPMGSDPLRAAVSSAGTATNAPAVPEPEIIVPTDQFAMRITGIGGTGVVTVAQVLGTAAMLAGLDVRGLDQIGLSQKAGPVVSDVRLSTSDSVFTNRLGKAQADLLLAFDQLVASSNIGLLTCRPGHTAVVGSTSTTPTGDMITHLDLVPPSPAELASGIGEYTSDVHHWADAHAVTDDLFGSTGSANFFVVGMAVQAGVLPIGASFIEDALTLNGVAVETNVAAFRWGRAQVDDPEAVVTARAATARSVEPDRVSRHLSRIDRLGIDGSSAAHLAVLADDLEAWGSGVDVDEWLDVVERVRKAELSVRSESEALTMALGKGLHKLVAYKDEYEVARLMLDAEAIAEAEELAGRRGKVAWKLHPPLLRALGMDRKITIGSWATPGVRLLAKGKRLRGTKADPFRWAEVRKIERRLSGEYIAAIDAALDDLTDETFDAAIALADAADLVRGYEDIKVANVAKFRAALVR
ncbi:MAG: indolepyruvate ferredoxin oxidoreductase family protein [Actinobacteria bacterium]|nr:indolepyruvate ferredoxin oxidoreductase family protein [Actinomycetota bacterium]